MDLSPVAIQLAAVAGILGSLTVIWRVAVKPIIELLGELLTVGRALLVVAAPDPNDPNGRPALVNATTQMAAQGYRNEQAIDRMVTAFRVHDDQDWAVAEALEDAIPNLKLPERVRVLLEEN